MIQAPGAARPFASTRSKVLLGLLCLIALFLRCLYAGRSGLWRDEALFLFVARLPSLADVFAFLQLHESHPPLFYLFIRGWQGLFGSSDAVALALPVILGVALVPAIYWVGVRVFSLRAGWLAASLVACSPKLAEQAAQVRLRGAGMARLVPHCC
jgi:mannosyltransferase